MPTNMLHFVALDENAKSTTAILPLVTVVLGLGLVGSYRSFPPVRPKTCGTETSFETAYFAVHSKDVGFTPK
jgi:hypothetical protein